MGNKVSSRRDNQVRVRDKSFIKKVKVRPDYLKPSWERNSVHPTMMSNYDEQEIECSWGESKSGDNGSISEPEVEEPSQTPLVGELEEEEEPINEKEDVDNGSISEPEVEEPINDNEMENHLNQLIENAQRRVTRSQGTALAWNPIMGDENVVLKK